jgi:hypothetical protein
MRLENRNCGYMKGFPQRALAGGSMWAIQLPQRIPKPGEPGGPPLPADYRNTWGIPIDFRAWTLEAERHPEKMVQHVKDLMTLMSGQMKK